MSRGEIWRVCWRTKGNAMRFGGLSVFLLLLSSIGTASAADPVSLPESVEAPKAWTFHVQPYLWAASMDVTSRPGARVPSASASLPFKEILENLKFNGTVAFSAHRGRFGVAGDLQYADLRASKETPGSLFSRRRVTTKLFIGSAFGEYKAIVDPRGELILSGGVRFYNSDTRLDLTAGTVPAISASASDFWADPMIGLRGEFNVTPKVFLNGWAYIGGFGVGSELSTDLFAGAGYKFTENVSANVGFRYLHFDRDTPSFALEMDEYGPFAGLIFSF